MSTIISFRITGNNPGRDKSKLANFLCKEIGFEPNHWYANWKELQKDVWLVFKNPSRSDPTTKEMFVELLLKEGAPNVGGNTLQATDPEQLSKYIENKIKPMVVQLLDGSGIKYEIVEEVG